MKHKLRGLFSIQIYFTLVVMAQTLVTIVAALLVTMLIQGTVHITITTAPLTLLILFSAIIGLAVSTVVNRIILAPIKRLNKSMTQVAEGHFDVTLETKSRVNEIKDLYRSFNLMTRELGATEILQTDFVSNVSHEFKTPINAIEGYATLLQDKRLTEKEREQYTDKILFNTRRLSKLVGNILLLSKVDNQAIQSSQTCYRLDEQVRQAIVALEPQWEEKDIEFDVDLERVAYTGCEGLMQHVWSNLIGNAIKFDPPGGWIRIRMKQREGRIVFTIEDNGPGVPESEYKHIFEKFYQSDSSHKQEGNGLGLALVKRILDSCGGTVSVESLLSGGSRFTVTLPQGEK